MKLTAELITNSPAFINPLKDRELDLRGNKIAVIENLGATRDQFDTLDLSDNDIIRLGNFPELSRLHTLLLNNNRIAKIDEGLGETLPNLETLVLTGNQLLELNDLNNLAPLSSLRSLSLLDNVVQKRPNYRLYVIHLLPSLRLLDFQKIKFQERKASEEMFGTTVVQPKVERTESVKIKDENLTKIRAAIKNAKTMEEVERLEKLLRSGDSLDDFANM